MKKIQTFIKRKIGGECVLIPTGETSKTYNGIFNLSETAELLWDHLEEAESLEALAGKMEEEYEVDHETAMKDTAELLSRLLGAGFITFSDPEKHW